MSRSEIDSAAPRSRPPVQEVSDEDLDRMILTRLTLLGVDLSVLPEDDPEAPADQRRILASARRFLRSTPQALADFEMDPQEVAPVMYPAALAPSVIAEGAGDGSSGSTGGIR
jgi:hypothetical protein